MKTFIISTDDYSVGKRKIDEIRNSINDEIDEIYYDLEDDSLYNIIDDLNTISLFDNIKFIVCKSAEKAFSFSKNAIGELYKEICNTESNNYLIFISTEGYSKLSEEALENYKKIKAQSTYIEALVKNISLDEYIDTNINLDNYKLDNDAKSLLLSYFDNLTAIETALDILKSYKMESKIIKKEDVLLMIPKPLDKNVYELINAVLKHDKKLVFQIYNDLKTLNVGKNLLSLLINKFQEMYNVNILVQSGITKDVISELFNVKPGHAYYMVMDAKKTSLNDIRDNLDYLNKLDYDIKSGKIEEELGLELYFLR